MPDQLFGALQSFADVEAALLAHLKYWTPTYLAARERHVSITAGTIARPRSWIMRQRFDALPGEDSTPAVVVVAAGTAAEPRRHGTGRYDIELGAAVVVLCHGAEAAQARTLAGHYQAALTTLLLQQRKFSTASIHDWNGLSLEDVPDEQTRTLCAVRMEFTIKVPNFVTAVPGVSPPAPPAPQELEPQPDAPIVIIPSVDIGTPMGWEPIRKVIAYARETDQAQELST